MAFCRGLTNSCEKKRSEKHKRKERYTDFNAECQRTAGRDKKAFLSDQCKEIEENNRMGKTEKAMATHSSTFAWTILWTEEPGRLQSMGSLRVQHD